MRLHVVTGKGGAGKTTVASALALALASGGKRVLLIEVEGRQGIAQVFDCPPLPYEERKIAVAPATDTQPGGDVNALVADPESALLEYLEMFYNLRHAGKALTKLGVKVEVVKPRSIQHHRWFFALVRMVWENIDHERYPSEDDLRAALTISAGHRIRIELPGGEVAYMARSIAWDKMDQLEFREFTERCLDAIYKHFIPGLHNEAVRRQIESLGTNLFVVLPGATTSAGVRGGFGSASTLTVADAQAVMREATQAQAVSYLIRQSGQVQYRDRNWTTLVQAVTASYPPTTHWRVAEGRALTVDEAIAVATEALT